MEELKELYESLFSQELELESYTKKLAAISLIINRMVNDGAQYFPREIDIFGNKSEPLGYVSIGMYEVYSERIEGLLVRMVFPGQVLLRHFHWDRDHYYNEYPHKEYVAGGPLEKDEWRINWLPLYEKEHVFTCFNRLQALHKKDFLETWEKEFEPQ